ncbi:Tungstate ABC transporter, ATP-binding protein [hydrothermal vent metagenome]|uniref:Tungstate ABC transporter, ATP-binding protein n=1 Tax=hydrothermal vent metagenome TaxID=652676 RepID=A0A3B0SWK2_9ZZZZ
MLEVVASAKSTAPTLVELRDVVFMAGGKRHIDNLSFRLALGAMTAIMGPNGAGKSLTLRLLQGLLEPAGGSIVWSKGLAHAPDRHRASIVFQKPVLLRRSVAANLRHALSVYGVPAYGQAKLVDKYLAMGGLLDLKSRPARVLSGGEQQRLSIVRALAAEPDLLLLDEPTASLDPQATQMIEALITEAHARGTTIVLVTHDPGQAMRVAQDIVFIHGGRVTEHSPADRFFEHPTSDAARAYLEGRLLL